MHPIFKTDDIAAARDTVTVAAQFAALVKLGCDISGVSSGSIFFVPPVNQFDAPKLMNEIRQYELAVVGKWCGLVLRRVPRDLPPGISGM